MNLWRGVAYSALALLAIAFFYVVLRWRRSPMAIRGMAIVAGLCFLSGLLIGIWLFHLVSGSTVQVVSTTPTPPSLGSPPRTPVSSPVPSPAAPTEAPQVTRGPTPTAQAPKAAPSVAAKEIAPEKTSPTDWLGRVNFYRSVAKLPAVAEDPSLSAADVLHARYLVKNRVPPDSRMHNEDPSNPWFTAEGLAAARSSDVVPPCAGCIQLSPAQAIDMWVGGPFHRLSILNPDLRRIGYGEFREDGLKAHVISVGGAWLRPGPLPVPVRFPADSTSVLLRSFTGEWPNPLSSCPGFLTPVGLPVTLELGADVETAVEQHRFSEDGRALEHCVFDASSYANADLSAQQWGRNILKGFGAVVLIPRSPLVAGHRYSVELLVSGRRYEWSFSIR